MIMLKAISVTPNTPIVVMLFMEASSLSVILLWTGCKLFKMATQFLAERFYKIRLRVEDLEVR